MGSKRSAVTASLLAIVFVMACDQSLVHARLGDDRGELTAAEGRYGTTTGSAPAVLKTSLEKADTFKHKGIKVMTEYDENGKVWRITYNQKDFSETLMAELMKRNGGERKWSPALKYLGAKHWVSTDKQMHAVYYGYPVYDFIIMTAESAKVERIKKTLDGAEEEIADEDPEEDETDEPKKTPDPLEGF